jgi:CspA family cold shock protein
METGTVKWYNTSKGYGFITYTPSDVDDVSTRDIFFHYNDLSNFIKTKGDTINILKPNDRVNFVTQPGKRCLRGVDVELIDQ